MWPPPEVAASIAALDRPAMAGVRWERPGQWHVTLRFLGQVDDHEVAALEAALAEVAARQSAVVAEVGPATASFGRRILHLPVSGLRGLAEDTVRSTSAFGEPPEPRPFAGHLTLARARERSGDVRPLAGAPIAGSWTVDELTLVRSTPTRDGASYDVVASWALTG